MSFVTIELCNSKLENDSEENSEGDDSQDDPDDDKVSGATGQAAIRILFRIFGRVARAVIFRVTGWKVRRRSILTEHHARGRPHAGVVHHRPVGHLHLREVKRAVERFRVDVRSARS